MEFYRVSYCVHEVQVCFSHFRIILGPDSVFIIKIDSVQPHVASIKEQGCLEVAEEPGPVLEVGQQFHVAYLYGGGCLPIVAQDGDAAGTYAVYGEGADAVGTAYIEQLSVRCFVGVSVSVDVAGVQVSYER